MSTLEIVPQSAADRTMEAVTGLSDTDYEAFLVRLLSFDVQRNVPYLREREAELLRIIRERMTSEFKREYNQLKRKLKKEVLTEDEHTRFMELIDHLERQNVRRYAALSALAAMRGRSLDELKSELKIKPLINE